MSIPTTIRDRILRRDGIRCARCARLVLDYPSSIHHRLPRRMGGTKDPRSNDLRNLIRVCGTGTTGCHGAIESHREQAYLDGWLIRSYDDLAEPLLMTSGLALYLTSDGDRTEGWIA